ncbi:MAG: metallophosphoesterase, partial [Planctomycetota bacterium]
WHVQPEADAPDGIAAAVGAVLKLDPEPEFVVAGGDQIMDAFATDRARADVQFDLFDELVGPLGRPVHACVGNHDVFGWGVMDRIPKEADGFGKELFRRRFGLEKTYRAFDAGDWRFYMLDNIRPSIKFGYMAALDKEQRAWLEADLAAKPPGQPAVVVSHVPIVTALLLHPRAFVHGIYQIPPAVVAADSYDLSRLFTKYGVKLALSGHLHLRDRVEIGGVTYINGGAVCGKWWAGPNQGVEEGFGVVDLYPDGRFAYRYADSGWDVPAG